MPDEAPVEVTDPASVDFSALGGSLQQSREEVQPEIQAKVFDPLKEGDSSTDDYPPRAQMLAEQRKQVSDRWFGEDLAAKMGMVDAAPDAPAPQTQVDLDLQAYNLMNSTPDSSDLANSQLREYREYRQSRGEDPFAYLPLAQQRSQSAEFRNNVSKLSLLYSGTKGMSDAFSDSQKDAFSAAYSTSLNKDRDKMQSVNMAAWSMDNNGAEINPDTWQTDRNLYAQQLGASTPTSTEEQLYALNGDRFRKENAKLQAVDAISKSMQKAAMQAVPVDQAWQQAATMIPDGMSPDEFKAAGRAAYAGILFNYSDPQIQISNQIVQNQALAEGADVNRQGQIDPDYAGKYGEMDLQDRLKTLALTAANASGQAQTPGDYSDRFLGNFSRALSKIGSGLDASDYRVQSSLLQSTLDKGTIELPSGSGAPKDAAGWQKVLGPDGTQGNNDNFDTYTITPDDRVQIQQALRTTKGLQIMAGDIANNAPEIAKYGGDHLSMTWHGIGDAGVMFAGMLPAFGLAATPGGVGLGAIAISSGEANIAKLQQQGAPDNDTTNAVGYAAGAVEAGTYALDLHMLKGSMPFLSSTLLKWGRPGAVALFAARTLETGAAATVQNAATSVVEPIAQQIYSAASQDIPGPDWNAIYEREKESLGDNIGMGLLFGIISATGQHIKGKMSATDLQNVMKDQQGMQLAGYDPARAKEIAGLADSNPYAAAELLKNTAETMKPEDRMANSQAAFEKVRGEKINDQLQQAQLPTIDQTDDGQYSVDHDGETVKYPTWTDAFQDLRQRDASQDVDLSKANQDFVNYLEAKNDPSSPLQFKGTTGEDLGTLQDWAEGSAEKSAVAYNRADLYYRQAGQDMGLEQPDLSRFKIFGSNVNEFADGVTTIVAKIDKGGSPLTVIEEHAEGVWKHLLDTETGLQQKAFGWVRDIEAHTGRSFLADSDDWADKSPELQKQDLVESLSAITVAHATGKVQDAQLPSSVRKFFRALKMTINHVLGLASDLLKLKKEGKLPEEFEGYLNRASGLDAKGEEFKARQAAGDDVNAMIPESTPEPAGDRSFSVAPEDDPLLAKIQELGNTDPEAKRAAYEKMGDAISEINKRSMDEVFSANDTQAKIRDVDAKEQDALDALHQKMLDKYGDDMESGVGRGKIRDIQRLQEGRITDKYDRMRKDIQADEARQGSRFEKIRDIATLETIARALPSEIRGKFVGDFRKLDDLQTPAARQRYLLDLLPKVETALETHLQGQYHEAIDKLRDKGAVKVSEARTRGGKIGASGHAVFEEVERAIKLRPDPADQKDGKSALQKAEEMFDSIQNEIEDTPNISEDRLAELDARQQALMLFAGYDSANSANLKKAHDFLTDVYKEGREGWLQVQRDRADLKQARIQTILKGLNADQGVSRAERNEGRTQNTGTFKKVSEGIMGTIASGGDIFRRLAEASDDPEFQKLSEAIEGHALDAELNYQDLNHSDNAALKDAFKSVFKQKSVWGIARKLHDLSELKENIPVTTLEGHYSETVGVPKEIVEEILNGNTGPSFERNGEKIELRPDDLKILQTAWDEFQQQPEKNQNRQRLVKFDRTLAEGVRKTLGRVSQLDALNLWLIMRQPDQFEKLEKMGYDAQTMKELNGFLTPEAQAVGLWMVDHIGDSAKDVEQLHRDEKGVGYSFVDNYFPVRNDVARADNGGLSLDGNVAIASGKSASFIKERVKNNAEPALANALAIYQANRAQTNFWRSHVAFLREWGGVLRDNDVATAIRTKMGEQYYRALTQRLSRIENNGRLNSQQALGIEAITSQMKKTFALGTLGLRLQTVMVHFPSVLNTAMDMRAGDLLKGLSDLVKNPAGFKDAWESPAIQRMWNHGGDYALQIAKSSGPTEHALLATMNSLAEKGLAPIHWAVTGSQFASLSVAYEFTKQRALESGMSLDDAKFAANAKIERTLLRSAYPTTNLAKSEIELRLSENPLGAMGVMFVANPRKVLSTMYMASREILTGVGYNGKGLAAQQLIVASVLMPAALHVIHSLYGSMVKRRDDEDAQFGARLYNRLLDPKMLAYTMLTDHLSAIPGLGDLWSAGVAGALKDKNLAKVPVIGDELAQILHGHDPKAYESSGFVSDTINKAVTSIGKIQKAESKEQVIDGGISLVQAIGSVIPGGSLFAQLGNLAETIKGTTTSNDLDVSDEERIRRIKSEFGQFQKQMKTLGPAKKENGKPDKVEAKRRDAMRADKVRELTGSLTGDLKEKALESLKTDKGTDKNLKLNPGDPSPSGQ